MKNLFALIIVLQAAFAVAQQDTAFIRKMQAPENDSAKASRWIIDYKVSFPACEVLRIPPKTVHLTNTQSEWEGDYNDKGLLVCIASLTIEPRFNFYSRYKHSLFVKAPLAFSLSVTYPGTKYNEKSWGVFNANVPVLIGFGKGLNSSTSNVGFRGYSLSVGGQLLYGPIKGAIYVSHTGYEPRRTWLMPLVNGAYYWLSKKDKVRGIDFTFSPKPFYFKAAYTFASNVVRR